VAEYQAVLLWKSKLTMNQTKAILAIIAGSIAITLGLTVKQFYAARGTLGVTSSNRQIARWKGRLLFLIVGTIMLLVGIKFFLLDQ
jgi:hypothetical protein